MDAHLPNAELAFLAACHSAASATAGESQAASGSSLMSSNEAPDEVLSLASAVQFCGFRSVVGTLWTMADADGPELAQRFYGCMMYDRQERGVDAGSSARALHVAVRGLREAGVPVERWSTFVHIGA